MHDNAHASDFPTGYNGYQTIWGMLSESGILKIGKVHATSTTTKIYIPFFQQRSGDYKALFPDDFFNAGWKIQVLKATNSGIVGKVYDITDFVASTGEFTTATADAAYTAGDVIRLFNTDNYPIGQEFVVRKRIAKNLIDADGTILTGLALGGDVQLKRIAIQNDGSAGTTPADNIYVYTDDVGGAADSDPLYEQIIAAGTLLTAKGFVTADIGYLVKAGKIVGLKNTNGAFAGGGNLTVHLTFVRNADGANILAA